MSEPIYTGPLPVQIAGDIALGKTYERQGRKLLGGLLIATGAAERIAAGEPGGYFKKSMQAADGTVITVITNNGQHSLRIETPRPVRSVEYQHDQRFASGSAPHTTFTPTTEGSSPPPEVPLPTPSTRDWGDEEPERKKELTEYMWVGARYTTPDAPWYVLGAMMIEPDTGPEFAKSGLPKRGIIDCINWWGYKNIHVDDSDDKPGEFTISQDPFYNQDFDSNIQDNYDAWYNSIVGHNGDEFDRAEQHIILGTHSAEVQVNSYDGVFLASANGLRCESIQLWFEGMKSENWLGFDPYADDQTGANVRQLGNRHANTDFGHIPPPNVLWDVVFTLDPHEDEQMMPCDSRPQMLAVRRLLEKEAGMVTQILPGEYILALHAMDDAPQLRSTRAGEPIPLYAGDLGSYAYRSAQADYDQYMQPISTSLNIGVEIEVRLGKGEAENRFHFETTIAEGSFDNWTNFPYGMDWYTPCDPDGGPNPVGPNFAPQYLAINPLAGSARWLDHDKVDLYPILGGGHFTHPGDDRVPLDVFIHVVPWSQPSDEDWPSFAGRALWRVLESASAGVYGHMLFKDPGGEAGCVAMFEGTSKMFLWKYDAYNQTMSAVPVLSEVDDYPYGGQQDEYGNTFQSPYEMNLFWYYPYKYITRNACRYSLGIAITAVFDSFSFDHGQHIFYADPPDTTDCC